jgi:hypothetical protein
MMLQAPKFGRDDAILFAVTTTLALVYGITHDHITASLSPEYFLIGKDLVNDPRSFRWAVTVLAAKATWPLGLLAGMAFRFANEPSRRISRQLPLRRLLRFVGVPIATAAIVAPILGALPVTFDPWDQHSIAEIMAGSERTAAFVRVWRVHIGSYAGGALGLLLAMALIRRQRAREE